MLKSFTMLSGVLAIVKVTGLSGCGRSGESPASSEPTGPTTAADSHAGHDHHGNAMHSEYEAELAKLSPQDRQLAEKQRVCPVSGAMLGSMGKPYKVTVQGREVLLCCPGCEAALKKDPDRYLAKLPE